MEEFKNEIILCIKNTLSLSSETLMIIDHIIGNSMRNYYIEKRCTDVAIIAEKYCPEFDAFIMRKEFKGLSQSSIKQYNDLISTNSALNNKSNNGHTHDNRYYTEAEMTNLLNSKANSSHNHDERYYTESEVNNLLNYKVQVNSNASLNSLELVAAVPYIDFHYGNSTADYTSRIIESSSGVLNVSAELRMRDKRVVYSENNNISFRNESGAIMAKIDTTDLGCLVNIPGHRMNFAWNGGLQRMYVWLDGVQLGYLNILQ